MAPWHLFFFKEAVSKAEIRFVPFEGQVEPADVRPFLGLLLMVLLEIDYILAVRSQVVVEIDTSVMKTCEQLRTPYLGLFQNPDELIYVFVASNRVFIENLFNLKQSLVFF